MSLSALESIFHFCRKNVKNCFVNGAGFALIMSFKETLLFFFSLECLCPLSFLRSKRLLKHILAVVAGGPCSTGLHPTTNGSYRSTSTSSPSVATQPSLLKPGSLPAWGSGCSTKVRERRNHASCMMCARVCCCHH